MNKTLWVITIAAWCVLVLVALYKLEHDDG